MRRINTATFQLTARFSTKGKFGRRKPPIKVIHIRECQWFLATGAGTRLFFTVDEEGGHGQDFQRVIDDLDSLVTARLYKARVQHLTVNLAMLSQRMIQADRSSKGL